MDTAYRHGAHSVFAIHLHLVWITKYRKPVLVGDVAFTIRDIIREICRSKSVEIMNGHISKDHIQPFCLYPAPGDDQSFGAMVKRQKLP